MVSTPSAGRSGLCGRAGDRPSDDGPDSARFIAHDGRCDELVFGKEAMQPVGVGAVAYAGQEQAPTGLRHLPVANVDACLSGEVFDYAG